jgi:hypothetical protein
MMRMLLVITAVSLTFVSGLAYGMAGVAAGVSGFSWNQAAAEESARAWAAEGWCFPGGWLSWGYPCPAPQPMLPPNRTHTGKHNHN